MKQRLCIGIQKLNPAWVSILNQAGVWYEEINYNHSLKENYSLILLNGKVSNEEKRQLNNYLQNGGAVIEIKGSHTFTSSEYLSQKRKTITNNSEHRAFRHINFLDVFSKVELHRSSDIFEGLVHIQKHGNGYVGFIGAELSAMMNNGSYTRKRFFNPTGKHPDEIVSKVSKHQLLQLFISLMKELTFLQGLHFVRKWDSPATKPVFCFRIDSDFGDQKSIDSIYQLAKNFELSLTWFLHVEAHEQWLNHFHNFENQEIALHGYSHGTSKSARKTKTNTQRGLEVLQKYKHQPSGFCAPYGIWNRALKKTLKQSGFDYTSEFTFAYDTLPQQPADPELPLQIPIHPICTGSLNRHKMNHSEMSTYFEMMLSNKLARFEPVLFYHHPLQVGLEAIEQLFKRVKAEKLENLSFAEFACFWKKRNAFQFEAFWENQKLSINAPKSQSLYLKVSNNHQGFDLISTKESEFVFPEHPAFEYGNQYQPEPEQILEMRKKDLKLLKTSILDWRNRIRL